jgi:uncharacterized protein
MKTGALASSVILCLASCAFEALSCRIIAAEADPHVAITPVIHVLPEGIKDEIAPADVKVYGDAPKTSWRLVGEKGPRTFLIVLGKNDDLIAALYKFAQANHIKGASFTGLGAVGCAALGFFDQKMQAYKVIKMPQQVELASLIGNIGSREGKYVVHTHAVVASEDGRCLGGHLLYAPAFPTVEIMLTETDTTIERHKDAETGLSLFDLPAAEQVKWP